SRTGSHRMDGVGVPSPVEAGVDRGKQGHCDEVVSDLCDGSAQIQALVVFLGRTMCHVSMASSWRKVPFFRWSFWRMLFSMKRLLKEWQVGDRREERLLAYVLAKARRGDVADTIRVIDEFSYQKSFLINVGDEKGAILEEAIRRTQPKRVLELGAY